MKETIIDVKGMVCEGCENRVKNALKNIEGIENVTANHKTGKVIVTSNKEIELEKIKDKIIDIGFEV